MADELQTNKMVSDFQIVHLYGIVRYNYICLGFDLDALARDFEMVNFRRIPTPEASSARSTYTTLTGLASGGQALWRRTGGRQQRLPCLLQFRGTLLKGRDRQQKLLCQQDHTRPMTNKDRAEASLLTIN